MSEELVNHVQEMLKEETWTRAAIGNYTKNNLMELSAIVEKARSEDCEDEVKKICDELLTHSKDSIVALYLSGMIALNKGALDNSALVSLTEIFEKNHKEVLVEYLCQTILDEDPQNKFALRKLADYYKSTNSDKVWELYEKIVNLDFEEADIAKLLAERYESQNNSEAAISYYKKALLRYVTAKNLNAVKEMWTKLVSLIP
jgi:transcription elongation factor GreA-like protein